MHGSILEPVLLLFLVNLDKIHQNCFHQKIIFFVSETNE